MKAALLDTVDDGLVARFIWAWPDAIPFRRPRQIADVTKLETAYRRLYSLSWGVGLEGANTPVTIPLSPEASDLFEQWAVSNETGIDDRGPLYKSFVGKMKGAVLRIALIAELAEWAMTDGPEPQVISADTLGAAADFVDEYAKPMAQRVYGDASLPAVERNAAILARYILKNRFSSINARELRRAPHKSNLPSLRAGTAMDETISFLCDADWLRDAGTREGGSAGQRRKDYLVNPAVFGGANG